MAGATHQSASVTTTSARSPAPLSLAQLLERLPERRLLSRRIRHEHVLAAIEALLDLVHHVLGAAALLEADQELGLGEAHVGVERRKLRVAALPLAREQRLEVLAEVGIEEVRELRAAVAVAPVAQGPPRLLEVHEIAVGALEVALARDQRLAGQRRRRLRRTSVRQELLRRRAVRGDDAAREHEAGGGSREDAKGRAAHASSPSRPS